MGEFLSDDQRLVFVGGLHRSGTTLLARLLAAHPDATGLYDTGVPEDEGQHLQDVYPPAKRLGGSGRFALNPTAHRTEDQVGDASTRAQQLWDAWRPYWGDSDARFLIEKSPPNIVMGRFLQALYPSASFVFIVRHPVTVTLATRKWRRRTPLPRLMNNWFTAHRTAQLDLPALSRVHLVSYEWLLADPTSTMTGIVDFLDMPGEIDVSSVDSAGSDRYEDQWSALLTKGHRGATKAMALYEQQATTFGYDLRNLRIAPHEPLIHASGAELP
ncbi:MAG: sulfotransferase [Actinomycetes bacterium]